MLRLQETPGEAKREPGEEVIFKGSSAWKFCFVSTIHFLFISREKGWLVRITIRLALLLASRLECNTSVGGPASEQLHPAQSLTELS